MSGSTISRRTALTGTLLTAVAAVGLPANASEAPAKARTAQEEKYLQRVMQFWKQWEKEPPDVEALAAMFTDDCIVRVGVQGEVVAQSKQAAIGLFKGIAESRFKVDVTRTFVTGRMVVTEFAFSSWEKKGDTPKQAPGLYAGVFIFKGDKIWMWADVQS